MSKRSQTLSDATWHEYVWEESVGGCLKYVWIQLWWSVNNILACVTCVTCREGRDS